MKFSNPPSIGLNPIRPCSVKHVELKYTYILLHACTKLTTNSELQHAIKRPTEARKCRLWAPFVVAHHAHVWSNTLNCEHAIPPPLIRRQVDAAATNRQAQHADGDFRACNVIVPP